MTLQPNKNNSQLGEDNPQDNFLNYAEARKQPIHAMTEYYKQADEALPDDQQSDGYTFLKEQYDRDPSSLSAVQLITLGTFEQQAKQQAKSQAKQARMKAQIAEHERQQERYRSKSETGANMTLRDFL